MGVELTRWHYVYRLFVLAILGVMFRLTLQDRIWGLIVTTIVAMLLI